MTIYHYTTARDLATIFLAALEHPEFVEIAGAATWDLPATSQNPARTLENTNLLIDPESPRLHGWRRHRRKDRDHG